MAKSTRRGRAPSAAPKRGRPPALTLDDKTIKQIEALAGIMCTDEEAAAVLKVAESSFKRFLFDHPSAKEAWMRGRANGRASLRRAQFHSALGVQVERASGAVFKRDPNPQMLQFLGKNLLGQRDRFDHVTHDEPPLDLTKLTAQELDAYERLVQKAADGLGAEVLGASEPAADPGRAGTTRH